MLTDLVPVRTAEGAAELAQRKHGLSQRHRTLLLLVDGRRHISEVLQMAAAAGVPRSCLEDLIRLGLVTAAGPTPSDESMLPPLRSLIPESEQAALEDGSGFDDPPSEPLADHPLRQAREMLARALRSEAPVAGSLTLLKLRRAKTREDVSALLEEIDQRIRKPRKQLMVDQLMRQVRHLLTLPPGEP
jgi:hypothetical protein